MSNNIRYNYSNGTGSIFPETHSKRIGVIIHLFYQFLSFNTKFPTDFGTIFQGTGPQGISGAIWPLFFTGVYYLVWNGVLTVLLGRLEKKLSYFQ